MANNNDGTEPSRYIKRRFDLEDADLILNQMLMKKQKSSFATPTIATRHETSQVQLNLPKQPMQDIIGVTCSTLNSSTANLEVNDIPDCTNEAPIEINLEEYGTGLEFGSQTASHHLKMFEPEECSPSMYLPILCLAFKIKHNLSSSCFGDALKLIQISTQCSIEEIKTAAKCEAHYNHLKHDIRKIFICMDKKCDSVLTSIGVDGLPTKNQPCGHVHNKLLGHCYVLILPIEPQVKHYLESTDLSKWNKPNPYDGSTRGDVQSGRTYRELMVPTSAGVRLWSYQLNVDGAICKKSSKFVFWPFMLIPNESPYRARRSSMMLLSLYYGNKKPPRGPFLNDSIRELEKLSTTGILFSGLRFLAKPLVLTTDTQARPVFLNCIIFSGECGCNFCLHTGQSMAKGRGHARMYPEPLDGQPSFALRTLEQHTTDLEVVLRTGKFVHGIKGPSPLRALTDFDYVKAQVPDYLHSACQGDIKFFLGLWTESKYHEKPWHLNAEKRRILNERLVGMRPPYEVIRTSRSIDDICHWKAAEFRAFALYYFPILQGLLPQEYYDHFLNFVYGLQVCLQEEVVFERIQEIGPLFRHFVLEAANLYGREHIRFNLHLATHFFEACDNWGCLWATSNFIPEWFNGQLASSVNGTQALVEQMAHTFLLRKVVRAEAISLLSKYILPQNVASLFKDWLQIPPTLFDTEEAGCFLAMPNGVKLLGRGTRQKTSVSFEVAICNYLKNSDFDFKMTATHLIYQRIMVPKIYATFATTSYTRSPKRINDCALMKDGIFFIIESIIYFDSMPLNNQPFIIGRSMGSILSTKCSPRPLNGICFNQLPGQSTMVVGLSKSLIAYSTSDILKKCVIVQSTNPHAHIHSYVVTALPNSVESD